MSDNTAIRLQDVHAGYGKMEVLFGITLHVANGEIVALVGPNGTGKTTTLRTIVGQVRARSGSLEYMGEDISHKPPYALTRKGIATSPEGRAILGNLTVLENLRLGAYTVRDPAQFRRGLERVYALFPRLQEREHQSGGSLSGGEQQMLAVGRALMSRPKLLLLDEPSLGIAPNLARTIFATFEEIRREGSSILIVEQNVYLSLRASDRSYVMERGKVVLEGESKGLLQNPHVKAAYLGVA
jgi:branched-chain amino acid transport system ATP-binding protein